MIRNIGWLLGLLAINTLILWNNILPAQNNPCGSVGRILNSSDTLCLNSSDTLRLQSWDGTIIAWEYATNADQWIRVVSNQSFFITPSLVGKTYFRVVIRKGNCSEIFSETVVRYAGNPVGYVSGTASGCRNRNQGVLRIENVKNSILRWESSTDQWRTVTRINHTLNHLSYYNLPRTTEYRAIYRNCEGSETAAQPVRITLEECDSCIPPRNIQVINVQSQEIIFGWMYNGGYQNFVFQYKRIEDSRWTNGGVLTGRSFRWRGILTCERYVIRLATVCGDSLSYSAWSQPCTVSVLSKIPNLRIEAIQTHSAIVSWANIGLSTVKYQIRYRPVGTSTWTTSNTDITVYQRQIIGLRSETNYEVQVRAFCPQGFYGEWSADPLIFKTIGTPPTCRNAPIGITVNVFPPNNQPLVQWQAIPNATGYEIQYGEKGVPLTAWRTIYTCAPQDSIVLPLTGNESVTIRLRVRSYCSGCGDRVPNSSKSTWSPVVEFRR
jgi:hypothetical protein